MDLLKRPEDLYGDWERTVSLFELSIQDAKRDIARAPEWAFGMTPEEYEKEIAQLKEEVDFNFLLSMLASIEALLVRNVLDCTKRRLKWNWARSLRRRFRSEVRSGRAPRIDEVLDCWKSIDSGLSGASARLKAFFNYRDWLAHGRHWSIHYRTIPKPFDVMILYNSLLSLMPAAVFED